MQMTIRHRLVLALGLLLLGLSLHWGAWDYPFVDYDDPDYVSANAMVQRGLSWDGIRWSFGAHAANWHPLTWLSHMLDVELFGLDAGAHHFSNLLLHSLNAALLFLGFCAATLRTRASLCLALLYLLHPLQVESTLWIAERKDLLSAFFALANLWAYVEAHRRGSRRLRWTALLLFSLGLLSKPMLVSWPLVLLLVDHWPLRRESSLGRLVAEKIPMFAASALVIGLTVWAQRGGGSVGSLELLPWSARVANAFVSYARYLQHYLLFTGDLVVAYPHPALVPQWGTWGAPRILASAGLLVGLLFVSWRTKRPALRVGLLWWVGMLVPVIGLLQVGSQSLADRYMLLPSIGLGIAICFAPRWPSRPLLSSAIVLLCVVLGWRSHQQGRLWASSEILFRHAVAHSEFNWFAWSSLGNALRDRGEQDEALAAYDRSLAIQPNHASAHYNRANALVALRRLREAEASYRRCLEMEPRHVGALNNLARVLLASGRAEAAVPLLSEALKIDPEDRTARLNLAQALHGLGRVQESALVLDPPDASPWTGASENLLRRVSALRELLRAAP